MANELALLADGWPVLGAGWKDLPVPFARTVFLLECPVAGTLNETDALFRTRNLSPGDVLVLRREPANADDPLAVAVDVPDAGRVGYLPRRVAPVLARLMDAGKRLTAKVVRRETLEQTFDLRVAVDLEEV